MSNKNQRELDLEESVNDMTETEQMLYKKIKNLKLTEKELDYYMKQLEVRKVEPRSMSISKDKVKFGIIGDTHIGNKCYDPLLMTMAAKQFNDQKVDFVIHIGDVVDGMYPTRPGHIYELSEIGGDAQINRAVKELKQIKQPIYLITGNHDDTLKKLAGMNVGTHVAEKLSNVTYLGEDYGRISLKSGVTIDMLHPGDGTAYAISYKTQKRADSLDGGKKPNILVVGHYHKMEYLFYRNIHLIQTGTFENQTPFMQGKGIAANKGFWIIDVYSKNKQVDKFVPQFFPCYD